MGTAEATRQHRAARRARGLCHECDQPAVPGTGRCAEHRERSLAYGRARAQQFAASGLCVGCGTATPSPGLKVCEACNSSRRERYLKATFGLSPSEYERILAQQGGVCFICGHPPKKQRLAVDHNHKTGLIRGLLCHQCNKALGGFRDSIEKLERAVKYLTYPPGVIGLGRARYGIKGRVTNNSDTRRRLNRQAA